MECATSSMVRVTIIFEPVQNEAALFLLCYHSEQIIQYHGHACYAYLLWSIQRKFVVFVDWTVTCAFAVRLLKVAPVQPEFWFLLWCDSVQEGTRGSHFVSLLHSTEIQ